MARYYLYRWSIQNNDPSFISIPEQYRVCLVGFRDLDPNMITTSSIEAVNGKEVTTYSGSVYILQDMDTNFRDWLEKNNIKIDPNNPITIKK